MTWTQLKEKTFYDPEFQLPRTPTNKEVRPKSKDLLNISMVEEIKGTRIHNHFECNEFLGNKKALFYCMRRFYEAQKKNVFDYLPVTFHVKSFEDSSWQ